MAGLSAYPTGLDSLSNPGTGDSTAAPSHANEHAVANDAIESIEGELGLDPSGPSLTVAARFTALDATILAIDHKVTIGLSAPGTPSNGWLWVDTNISPPALKDWNGAAWVSAVPAAASVAVHNAGISTNLQVITTSTSYQDAGPGVTLACTYGKVMVIAQVRLESIWNNGVSDRDTVIALAVDGGAEIQAHSYGYANVAEYVQNGGTVLTFGLGVEKFVMYLFSGLSVGNHTFKCRSKADDNAGNKTTGNAGIDSGTLIAYEI